MLFSYLHWMETQDIWTVIPLFGLSCALRDSLIRRWLPKPTRINSSFLCLLDIFPRRRKFINDTRDWNKLIYVHLVLCKYTIKCSIDSVSESQTRHKIECRSMFLESRLTLVASLSRSSLHTIILTFFRTVIRRLKTCFSIRERKDLTMNLPEFSRERIYESGR